MILDQLPEVQKLSAEQKLQLAEELRLAGERASVVNVDPSVLELLNARLNDYASSPGNSSSWSAVRDRVFGDKNV